MPNEVNIFAQRFGAVLRGPSAYELAVAGGYQGTLEQWLADRQGLNGTNGWSPTLAVVSDGERRVLRVTDWTGGSGTKPAVGQYIGPAGLTAVLADAIDVRGGLGGDGTNGWAPTLAVVSDGARRVLRVVDWTGGSGTKPTTGQYVGAAGLTAVLADAIDVRGGAGSDGTNGWAPTLAIVSDGERRVLRVTDWTGGSGTKPTTGQYVGAAGLTAVLAEAIDVRGATGIGTAGASAWTPVLAVVPDGARRVLQVADWIGGSGMKPATGLYVGPAGLTAVLADAIDVRGGTGGDGTNGWAPTLAVVNDGARRVLRVVDWTGGSGTKPTTGQYVGATGLTTVLADAIDVRGGAGSDGTNGWAPTLAVVNDGARRVLRVVDWTGGSGTKPTTGLYVGAAGLTAVLADAIDVRGGAGSDGTNGWTPTLAIVSDGERRVLRVTDWTGGSGTKPTTGQYVGPTGLTAVLAEAIDVRGATGTGTPGANAWTPILAVVSDGARRVLQVADWTGGSGTKPTTGVYLASSGFTTVLANAVDIRALTNTDGLAEGTTNLWFTVARALAAVEGSNAAVGEFTMATRPAAAPANRGRVILVTGIGNVEFVQMISTGSKWVPFGGSQLLYHWTAPSANVTTPGTATSEVTVTDRVMTIPAGLATPSSLFEHRSQARWPAAVGDNTYRVKSGSASLYVSTTGQLYAHPNTRFWNKGALNAQRRSGAASGGTGMGHTTSDTYTSDIAIDTGAEWTITPTLAGAAATTAYVEFSTLVWVDA